MRLVRCPPPRRPHMRARGRGAINAGGRGRWRPAGHGCSSMCLPAETLWLAALAGLKHPFPSRTRPLRAPAAMILRSGARESSALPTSFPQPRATRSRGAFSYGCQPGAPGAALTRHGIPAGGGHVRALRAPAGSVPGLQVCQPQACNRRPESALLQSARIAFGRCPRRKARATPMLSRRGQRPCYHGAEKTQVSFFARTVFILSFQALY